ncbi:hypothetical protein pEaSNUABM38_00096 [Erwinia phage pEa_SNUABM_38]|nr:hypothetical protein pEaSNUABM38_00096 [Erwinia phage pEa_SNUABM_38]
MGEIRDVEFVVFTDMDSGLYRQLEPQLLALQAELTKQELASVFAAMGIEPRDIPLPPAKPDWWKGSLLVAYNADRVHGFVSLRKDSVETQAKINNLIVHQESRGFGIASELMARATEQAQGEGYTSIVLEVMHDNPAAEALYRKLGFVFLTKKMCKLF